MGGMLDLLHRYCADRSSNCSLISSILDSRCKWSIFAIKCEPMAVLRASFCATWIFPRLVLLTFTLQTDAVKLAVDLPSTS